MNFDKLEALARTPRVINDDLLKIHGKPLFFLKKAIRSWEQGLTNGPVVYGFVVQGNSVLFEPGGALAPAVMLYTEDPRYCRDPAWLGQLAERLLALKTSGVEDQEVNMLGALLAAEESEFDKRIPLWFTGGVEARLYTTHLATYKLPNECVGPHRLVPLLLMGKDEPIEIPGEFYS